MQEFSSAVPSYISAYWGKSRPETGHAFHPVAYHCLDVGACALAILDASPSALSLLAKALGVTDLQAVKRTAVLLAILHDIGKFAASFQSLRRDLCAVLGRTPLAPGYYSRKCNTGHDSLGLWLWEKAHLARMLMGLDDQDVERLLATGAFGHHGRPVGTEGLHEDLGPRFPQADRDAALDFSRAVRELFKEPLALPASLRHAKRASFIIAAIVNAADWLASSDVQHFPSRAPDIALEDYWVQTGRTAHDAVAAAGLVPASAPIVGGFAHLYPGLTPSPLQTVADTVDLPEQFLILMEEMPGGGKTEAALVVASRALVAGSSRGLFFGLPTTATADAQAVRQAAYYSTLFSDQGVQPSLTLAHSMTRSGTVAEDGASCAEWIADDRRLRLLSDVCVGTIDQALLAALPARFSSLRLFGLLGKVLVIDEGHAYDQYTTHLVCVLLRLHAALGGSAILLSATLTAATKALFAKAFASGAGFQSATSEHISHPAYPLVTVLGPHGSQVMAPARSLRAPPDKRVRLVHTVAEAQQIVLDCARSGRCVAWIRNTVDAAISASRSLRAEHDDVTLLHARFPESWRSDIQGRILARFGKHGPAQGRAGGIVVSTAILEQSLDLDFDLTVVDLKPMDSIIQALGRALRHARAADGSLLPDGVQDGRPPREMVILAPDPSDVQEPGWYGKLLGKAQFVHQDPAVLWRTAAALAREGAVTYASVRRLVEEAYDSTVQVPDCLIAQSCAAQQAAGAKRAAARGLTASFSPESGYDDVAGTWDDNRIPTRLGDSIEVVIVRQTPAGIRPLAGQDWTSGRIKLRLNKVVSFDQDALPAEFSEARNACKFSLLVPVSPVGNELRHSGAVVKPFRLAASEGLSWL